MFYDLVDRDMNGNDVSMSKYKGQANYKQLGELAHEFDEGFKVLAFPCNQFAAEEPGTHEEILQFASQFQWSDRFDFFEKANVNDPNARQVYSFLKQKLPNKDGTTDVTWNFTKFLVDHEGTPFKRYDPSVPPYDMKADLMFFLNKREESKK